MELHCICYLLSPSLPSLPTSAPSPYPHHKKKQGRRKILRPNSGEAALGERGEKVSSPCWLGAQVDCLFGQTDPVSWGFHSVLAEATQDSFSPQLMRICCSLLQSWMSHSPDEIFPESSSSGVQLFWIPGLSYLRLHQQIWTKGRIFLVSGYWTV